MKLHVLAFGAPAWEKRADILKELITKRPGPPHDFRDVLYLVPNERSIKTLKALFLDALTEATGSPGCIPPDFCAMNQFIDRITRRASALPLIDATAKSLVMEELCRKAASEIKGAGGGLSEISGASLAAGVAASIELVYTYGVGDDALSAEGRDSLPISILLRVKSLYEAWLGEHGLSDPAREKSKLRFCPGDFQKYRTVIMDGFYDADPVELEALRALSGSKDPVFVLEAPGLVHADAAREGMPYHGAHKLFSSLGLDIRASAGKPGRHDTEAGLFTASVFGGSPIRKSLADIKSAGALSGSVRVLGCLNPSEEAHVIARDIKSKVLSGEIRSPGRVLVFIPAIDEYRPMVEEAFSQLGIPCHISQGRPLSSSPVVTALINLLSLPMEGYAFFAMRKVFFSPLVKLSETGNHAAAFDSFGRDESISSGKARWLGALVKAAGQKDGGEGQSRAASLRGPLARLFEITSPVDTGGARLETWARAALGLIESSGLSKAVLDIDDGHKDGGDGDGHWAGLSPALSRLVATVEDLAASSARLGGVIGIGEFIHILKRAISEKRYSVPDESVSGVRVLGRLETLSEPFDAIYAGGLTENALPRARAHDIFFPERVAASLGLPSADEERTRDSRLFLGLVTGAPGVTLTYPESKNGGPASPSPYIRALEPFVQAGAITHKPGVSRPLEPADALGEAEALRSLALRACAAPGGDARPEARRILGLLPGFSPGLVMARKALETKAPGPPPTPRARGEFHVTELEEYILCHYRYYRDRVLGARPPEEPEDDIAPHKAGSIIHEIFHDFYESRQITPVTEKDKTRALDELKDIAAARFSGLAPTPANRVLEKRFMDFLAPRFIDAEAKLSVTGFGVCKTESTIRIDVDAPGAGRVTITGKLDRVEIDDDGNFAVADYKTGAYPGISGRPLDDMFQLPLYAYMVREKPDAVIKGGRKKLRPAALVYYNLKEGRMRDAVAYDAKHAGKLSTTISPKRKMAAGELDELLDESFRKAVEAISGIAGGKFEPSCDKDKVCERCYYISLCPKWTGRDRSKGVRGAKPDERDKTARTGGGGKGGGR